MFAKFKRCVAKQTALGRFDIGLTGRQAEKKARERCACLRLGADLDEDRQFALIRRIRDAGTLQPQLN